MNFTTPRLLNSLHITLEPPITHQSPGQVISRAHPPLRIVGSSGCAFGPVSLVTTFFEISRRLTMPFRKSSHQLPPAVFPTLEDVVSKAQLHSGVSAETLPMSNDERTMHAEVARQPEAEDASTGRFVTASPAPTNRMIVLSLRPSGIRAASMNNGAMVHEDVRFPSSLAGLLHAWGLSACAVLP